MNTATLSLIMICAASMVSAEAPRAYEIVKEFAAWSVACDIEEDMGDTNVFDCGVVSKSVPGIAFLDTYPGRTPVVWFSNGVSELKVSETLSVCLSCTTAAWCKSDLDSAPLLTALQNGKSVHISTGTKSHVIPGDAFSQALSAARRFQE